jgi:outer membrane protein OmpA-like peptidoglycan-associated protein
MKYFLLIILFHFNHVIKSQNLIRNPDFRDVTIFFQNGKVVYPNDWKSLVAPPFPCFMHPAKKESRDFFSKENRTPNTNGVVGIHVLRPSEGIITKLISPLTKGKTYEIVLDIKFRRSTVDSDFRGIHINTNTGEIVDSIEKDYNYLISLITYFSPSESNFSKKQRRFVIFDFPKSYSIDSTGWIKLSKLYVARGDENYYTIGTDNSKDYIDVLRKINNDSSNYDHRWAYYLVRSVNIFPHINNAEPIVDIMDHFMPDSIFRGKKGIKLILRSINFDLASFDLKEDSKFELNRVAEYLKNNLNLKLRITGHTDTLGTVDYNKNLSLKRAGSVFQYLVNHGINKDRISIEGRGESQPLNENHRLENMGVNRRVEFEFALN